MTMDDGSPYGAEGGTPGPIDPAPPAEPDRTQARALMAFAGIAAVVLVVGLVVWFASGGSDDDVPSASVSTTTPGATTVPATVTTVPTSTSAAPPDTTAPPTTAPPTTAPPTTAPPAFSLPEPGAESWTVPSDYEPIAPQMTLALASTTGDVRVFDGVVEGLRCVGVVGPGDAVTTWCGAADVAASFVADRGLDPVFVELGATSGDVTVTVEPTGWTLASNGCSDPMATILGGVDPGALSVTGVICRGDEAFLGIGTSLFGPGVAPDGGGILAAEGDEGWNVLNFGTSIGCDDLGDGVDRCALFGVEFELFEALLPLPTSVALGATSVDVAAVTDRTADVEAWIGGVSDPDEIVSIVLDNLVDPDAEVPATSRRADGLQAGGLDLLVVEIPQLDDSIATETWAVWIGAIDGTAGVTAFSWATCARGVTGDGLCV